MAVPELLILPSVPSKLSKEMIKTLKKKNSPLNSTEIVTLFVKYRKTNHQMCGVGIDQIHDLCSSNTEIL